MKDTLTAGLCYNVGVGGILQMVSTSKCEYCGATLKSSDRNCPQCGAPNPNYVPDGKRQIFLPKTIEELKEYCAERGMPLLRMRFFIGEDFKEPKAFGIYQDGSDFVVYKNKANGQRAVRYHGPDEEYAVNELFQKLLEECHNRGIYPDGKPVDMPERNAARKKDMKIIKIAMAAVLAAGIAGTGVGFLAHRHDGYYVVKPGNVYYHYGNDWYTNSGDDWYEVDDFPYDGYDDYFVGDDYDSDWGVSDFRDSEVWEEIQESHSSSSSDYDDWDSGDTDWDSDW